MLAEHYCRRLLNEHPTANGTTALQQIKLAELLLDRGSEADLEEVDELLSRWVSEGLRRAA